MKSFSCAACCAACCAALVVASLFGISRAASASARQTTRAPEKDSRTAAQQKIDSQLLYEIYRKRGQAAAKQVPPGPTLVRIDTAGRALVDIRAKVTDALIARVKKRGGVIVSSSVAHHSIIARVPLLQLEGLAADAAVRAIVPAAEAVTLPKDQTRYP